MKRNVSLKDIAESLGVSIALVSYVLNGKASEARVSPNTSKLILDRAKEMNYVPNQIAKSLKSGKTNTIGFIVADISNPFFANLARTIENAAKKSNYTVIFGSSDENKEKQQDLINVFIKRQVEGFIIAPTENSQAQIEYLEKLNFPVVLIDRYFPEVDSNSVTIDNYEASHNAVSHLIKNGFKRIALVIYKSNLSHMQDRKKGYLTALSDHGIADDKELIKEINYNRIEKDMSRNLFTLLEQDKKVDAIFFATNSLALHGLRFLNNNHYRIPDDVALVCFDQSDAFDIFYSPLTYVCQSLPDIGKEAVSVLLENVKDHAINKKKIVIQAKLMERGSSERREDK